ncbi:3330_t:CDS:1 [Funneliformis caledonium]|uniref:3330_t:CDS:1 n=1 Tax=Funneliformis caledonium TaxID=1117310 RepID=A0A9N9AS40_9GLOM|nr:3330_t:CDS:1 [Funneliformis caledonium]
MPVAHSESTKPQRELNEPIKQEKEIDHTQTEGQNTITPTVPLFTLWDYLKDELTTSDVDTLQELKRERVTNFLGIPWSIEKLMIFGFFICFDSFLYTITILPLRVIFAFYSLIMNIISFFNNDRHHERKHYEILNLSQKCDLLKGLLIILVCLALQNVEASQIYHIIRGQSAIKLYVIFNVLEILDRLCCSFGGDILDSLFSRSTLGNRKEDSKIHPNWRPVNFFILALIYILIHSIILFYQAITLNVAINSYSNALLTLLLSNQFIEIKGSVFKRFEKENLFQLSCADIVERFQLVIFLSVITARNLIELSGSPPSPFSILPTSFIPLFPAMTTVETLMTPVLFVLMSELLVDWLKHAFITKFNHIRTSVYDRYIDMLSRDLIIGNPTRYPNHNNHVKSQKFVDQSPIVSRRIGFAALPLTCFTISVTLQTVTMIYDWVHELEGNSNNMPIANVATQPPIVWILCGTLFYVMLILLKLFVGINLLGFAHRRYASMEMREAEESAQAKKLEDHVVAEKEEKDAKSRILNNSNDNIKKPEVTLDNIDRYTLFKSRIP